MLHALSGDERIVEAMRKAVAETMREMEQEMHARVRKNGAFEDRKTGNMVWAEFTHLTSRPALLEPSFESRLLEANPWLNRFKDREGSVAIPDPHLHSHVYVINATFDATEKQWKAGEFMRLKRDATYYQAAYHARLAGELQQLGYAIEPTANAFEIAGVPRSMVEVFSRRTKEIEAAAKALGIVDDAAKDTLGALTRRGKASGFDMLQLRRLWRAFVDSREVQSLDGITHTARTMPNAIARNSPEAARAGIDFALGHELERVSEVSERRLLARALMRAVGAAGVALVHRALRENKLVLDAVVDGERRITTPQILAEEAELMRHVRSGRGQVPPLVVGDYRFQNSLFTTGTKDTAEQRQAVLHVLKSQDWMVGIVGRAGTGKTTLLKEIHEGLRAVGKPMVLCAPTAEAARGVLRGEGFAQADTVKRLLVDTELQSQLRGAVLWIDEAGMIGNRDMLAIMRLARAHGAARVVLAGDPTQIRSVPRGDAFLYLQENAGLSVARLEQIKRQRTPNLKAAIEAISKGRIEDGLRILERNGAIIEGSAKKTRADLARAYVDKVSEQGPMKHRKTALVISPTHAEGEAITKAIRAELRLHGGIATDERKITRTVNLSWTEKERANPASYQPGLVVQFKRNAKGFRISERARIIEVRANEGKVTVRTNDGAEKPLPLKDAARFQVYAVRELPVSIGDRLKITENSSDVSGKHRLNNGDVVRVAGFTKDRGLVLENGRELPRDFGHLTHGYVITADAAQAKTVDAVYAAIGRESFVATDIRRIYVALSRARDEARIYTDSKPDLLKAAQRDNVRRSATELIGEARSRAILRDVAHREARRQQDAALAYHRERQRARESQQITRTRTLEREIGI